MKPASRPVQTNRSTIAPFTGAWIETLFFSILQGKHLIAPFTGAWIETVKQCVHAHLLAIAPFTGAWIETVRSAGLRNM